MIDDRRDADGPRFPVDFLVLGAQKAGTSWLHARLREHAGFWLPVDKDYEFFSYPGAATAEEFRARFAAAPADARIGDACASYFWTTGHSTANPGFARDLPGSIDAALGSHAKYIVLLRDPVDRAVSAYLHHLAFGSVDAAVPLLQAPESLGLVDIGRYACHLEAWLDQVGAERLCVLPAPSEVAPAEVLAQAVRFLGGAPVAAQNVECAVFEGMPRRQDAEGVWVSADLPNLPSTAERRVDERGQQWARVVDPATLDALIEEFSVERRQLDAQLRRAGADADWLGRWAAQPV